ENGRAYGPGAYDMKAGLVVLVEAVRAAGDRRRALRVFLTADEEIGSLTGRPLIEEAAGDVAAALVLEPPTQRGNLKTARKGLARYRLVVRGRAAHAGTHPDEGASARAASPGRRSSALPAPSGSSRRRGSTGRRSGSTCTKARRGAARTGISSARSGFRCSTGSARKAAERTRATSTSCSIRCPYG